MIKMEKTWFDGEFYKFNTNELTADELRTLRDYEEHIKKTYGVDSVAYFDRVVVISDCIMEDIVLHIEFQQFLKNVEDRIYREWFGFDDTVQQIVKEHVCEK